MSHMSAAAIDRMNAKRAWDWSRFQGSPLMLKFMRRDLPTLDRVIEMVPRHRVCVQAGGALGIFPKRLAETFDEVLTFEPDPDNFVRLCLNAPEPTIRAYPVALGAVNATVGLCKQRRDGKPENHEGCVHVAGDGEVPMLRLDELQLRVCDLLYLDVEGYELFALQGAAETLRRCRPVIALEVNANLGFYGLQESDLVGYLASSGYRRAARLGSDQVFVTVED
jgi:FkbM family methyltransferase